MFRVIIAGSRNFNDYYMLRDYSYLYANKAVLKGFWTVSRGLT